MLCLKKMGFFCLHNDILTCNQILWFYCNPKSAPWYCSTFHLCLFNVRLKHCIIVLVILNTEQSDYYSKENLVTDFNSHERMWNALSIHYEIVIMQRWTSGFVVKYNVEIFVLELWYFHENLLNYHNLNAKENVSLSLIKVFIFLWILVFCDVFLHL